MMGAAGKTGARQKLRQEQANPEREDLFQRIGAGLAATTPLHFILR
jgi:hypothetical protein